MGTIRILNCASTVALFLVLVSAQSSFAKPNSIQCEDLLIIQDASKVQLASKIHLSYFAEPEITNTWELDGHTFQKMELAEITSVDDLQVQKMIAFVQVNGGQVRLLKTRRSFGLDGSQTWLRESPYFWVNLDRRSPSYLIPVIALDLTEPRALASLAHEFEHFKIWLGEYRLALRKLKLDDPKAKARAMKEAVRRVWQIDMIAYGERLAVDAEIQMERLSSSNLFNRPYPKRRPIEFWEPDFVNRITYPELQAVRLLLVKDKPAGHLRHYMNELLDRAVEGRALALDRGRASSPEVLKFWQDSSAFELLLKPFGSERLRMDGTLEKFKGLLQEMCLERHLPEGFCREE